MNLSVVSSAYNKSNRQIYALVLILNKHNSDFTSSVFEAGVLLERNKPVRIVKRKWTSRECSATRILFKLSFVVGFFFQLDGLTTEE